MGTKLFSILSIHSCINPIKYHANLLLLVNYSLVNVFFFEIVILCPTFPFLFETNHAYLLKHE